MVQTPGVLLISSHVARGAVGLRASAFACERLGLRTWSAPTVMLGYHPGQGRSERIVTEPGAFQRILSDLVAARWANELRVVVSGYLGSADQTIAIAKAVGTLKAVNPDLIYICDPVIGDQQGIYVPEATAVAIRDRLLPIADVATPNLAELGWLTGRAPANGIEISAAGRVVGATATIVTSVPAMMRGSLAIQVVEAAQTTLFEHPAQPHAPSGTGDLFTGLVAAHLARGSMLLEAAERAAASVCDIVQGSVRAGADELMIPELQSALQQPISRVQSRKLIEKRG